MFIREIFSDLGEVLVISPCLVTLFAIIVHGIKVVGAPGLITPCLVTPPAVGEAES